MPEIPSTQILGSSKGLSIPERIEIVEDLLIPVSTCDQI